MNSCSSLATSYAGSSNVFVLQLERHDGGEIILQDVQVLQQMILIIIRTYWVLML